MKSPFPGMDPYLEPHWLDVHSTLATSSREALNQRLPDDLIASVEERVAIESSSGEELIFGPDVRVFEPPAESTTVVPDNLAQTSLAPYRLVAQVEPITERFIKIVEAGTERLVTVIEFVSPTNKRSEGLQIFRAKRAELLASGVNFVEVDLVRAGDWKALLRPHRAARELDSTYRVVIRIPSDPAAVYVHPIRLQDRLPEIIIPLRKDDPEIKLDLQTMLEHAYASGRYHRRLSYREKLEPSLNAADTKWAAELLSNRAAS